MTNFAIADATGILSAFTLFGALAFCPGYLVGFVLNLWDFRSRTFAFQLSASVPLSLGIGPIFTFLVGSVTSWNVVWLCYLGLTIGALLALFRARPQVDKTVFKAFCIGLAWCIFGAIWLMDWQFSSRVYFPIYAFDYSTRAAFVHSLAAFGLPAQTPFFNPGHPVALHYHFLWLLQCALVHWLVPQAISARAALIAGTLWCGLGLICVAALAMRILMQRRSWIVIALLFVTGLDIIPSLLLLLANRTNVLGTLPPSAEWWNEQVDGWIYTALWQPHYICALVACVSGLLLIWDSRRVVTAVVAALCFATAVGSGSFVALVFAVFLTIWMLFNLRESFVLALTGLLTVIFSLPYLQTLRGPAQNVKGESLLKFTVRPFSPVDMLLDAKHISEPWMLAAVHLLALPLNYFLELGFFAACVWMGHRRKLAPTERILALMALVSIMICTFAKSGATPNNDLGWRGFLVAQFALLILAAAYLQQTRATVLLKILLALGLAGTGYDLLLTRLFPLLSDANEFPKLKWLAQDQLIGERTFANREAYAWLANHSSQTATIAQNPDVDSIDIFSGLYADRRIVAGDRTCTIGFGGSASECAPLVMRLTSLFAAQTGLEDGFRSPTADFWVVKDTDPAWLRAQSWVWAQRPVFANKFVRIFVCERSNRAAK